MRLSARATALAFAALALVPAGALAQDEGRPSMTVGPVEIRPRLLINSIGVESNVFNERDDPKQDFTFSVQPDVEFSVRPGRARITWVGGAEFVYFHEYKDERSVNRSQTVSADLNLDWFRPFATYATSHTRNRANAEIDVRARRRPVTYTAGASIRLATRTSATFTYRGSREEFDDDIEYRGQELAETLNQKGRAYEGALGLQLTPVTAFSVVFAREEVRFDESPLRDSNSYRVAPTLSFSPLGLLTGTASVGYRRFRGLDPALPEYNGLAMAGTLAVVLGGRYRVDTRFGRDVRYSYEEAFPYYVTTGGRATIATQISDRFDFRVTGGREHMAYRAFAGGDAPGADREDVYGGGIGTSLGDRRRVVVNAEFIKRHSQRDTSREYRNRRIYATLTWGV